MVPPAPDVPCPAAPPVAPPLAPSVLTTSLFTQPASPLPARARSAKTVEGRKPWATARACFVVVRRGMGREGDVAAHGVSVYPIRGRPRGRAGAREAVDQGVPLSACVIQAQRAAQVFQPVAREISESLGQVDLPRCNPGRPRCGPWPDGRGRAE